MPDLLASSQDIIANSVSTIDANTVVDTMDFIGQVNRIIAHVFGNPPLHWTRLRSYLKQLITTLNCTQQSRPWWIRRSTPVLQPTTVPRPKFKKLCLDLIDHALPSLDTFNELAIALGYVAIYATTIQNQMALKASISYVDSALALKQPTITSATNLIINRLITITLEPPTGFTDLQLRANTVYVGTVFRNSFTIRSQRSVSGLLLKVSRFKHGAQLYMHHQPRYLQHLDV